MKERNSVRFEFPSLSENEGFSRGAVACFISQVDMTVSEAEDIKTAVSEAVTNCIVHAYPDGAGPIFLCVKIMEDETIEITIRDEGRGIPDVEEARKLFFTTGGEERSGVGFTIMAGFMDTLSVQSAENRGTTVTMSKKVRKLTQGE